MDSASIKGLKVTITFSGQQGAIIKGPHHHHFFYQGVPSQMIDEHFVKIVKKRTDIHLDHLLPTATIKLQLHQHLKV